MPHVFTGQATCDQASGFTFPSGDHLCFSSQAQADAGTGACGSWCTTSTEGVGGPDCPANENLCAKCSDVVCSAGHIPIADAEHTYGTSGLTCCEAAASCAKGAGAAGVEAPFDCSNHVNELAANPAATPLGGCADRTCTDTECCTTVPITCATPGDSAASDGTACGFVDDEHTHANVCGDEANGAGFSCDCAVGYSGTRTLNHAPPDCAVNRNCVADYDPPTCEPDCRPREWTVTVQASGTGTCETPAVTGQTNPCAKNDGACAEIAYDCSTVHCGDGAECTDMIDLVPGTSAGYVSHSSINDVTEKQTDKGKRKKRGKCTIWVRLRGGAGANPDPQIS